MPIHPVQANVRRKLKYLLTVSKRVPTAVGLHITDYVDLCIHEGRRIPSIEGYPVKVFGQVYDADYAAPVFESYESQCSNGSVTWNRNGEVVTTTEAEWHSQRGW